MRILYPIPSTTAYLNQYISTIILHNNYYSLSIIIANEPSM